MQGRKRERAKGILDLATTGAEMAGAGRSGRLRLGTYRAPVAVASHPKLLTMCLEPVLWETTCDILREGKGHQMTSNMKIYHLAC
jgi:hypothetical protein